MQLLFFYSFLSVTFSHDAQRVQRDPQTVSEPRQQLPLRADAGQHVEWIPEEEEEEEEELTLKQEVARSSEREEGDLSPPEDLDGAPQVEHEEDDGFVLHLFQAAEDDEEDDVPADHLRRQGAEFKKTKHIRWATGAQF